METGYWTEGVRVRQGAEPIDNVAKFAWSDDDWESYREWVEYTDQEKLDHAKGVLCSTDYIMCRAFEELISAGSIQGILSFLKRFGDEYADVIRDRSEARSIISSIESARDVSEKIES